MTSQVRTYFALFTLAIFLFPFVEKELHTIEHADDFHCLETSQSHVHEVQHHCSICDFNLTPPFESMGQSQGGQFLPYTYLVQEYHSEPFVPRPKYFFALKAPPNMS